MRGIAASPGVAIGRALRWRSQDRSVSLPTSTDGSGPDRWARAVSSAREELAGLKARVAADIGEQEAEIFGAQLLMLQDRSFTGEIERLIQEAMEPEQAVEQVAARFQAVFDGMDDPYLKERGMDVLDVGRRLIRHLTGRQELPVLTVPAIILARDLTPSDTVGLDRKLLLGLATETGGPTSHTAILARALGIPAVVGCSGLLDQVSDGELVVLDGERGVVLIRPDQESLEEARVEVAARKVESERAATGLPAQTMDGHTIELAANIAGPQELPAAIAAGADAVGLFRTEFLFMERATLPDEEEQFQVYRAVAEAMNGKLVIIRTLDAGGDKEVPALGESPEANPFLGCRALRICLARPDIFKPQLKAILRAALHGHLAVMFPMVSNLEEVRQAKARLAEAAVELAVAGVDHAPHVPIGIMIETPAAALIAAALAAEVDFFSIGSNDLVQYTLAVDRGNPRVAQLYQPYHPAVLHLIGRVVEAGQKAGRWVGICGELGGDPLATPLLIGLGLHELSMSASRIGEVRLITRSLTLARARAVAAEALNCATASEVEELLRGVNRELRGGSE